jgi:acyl-CoA thioester hydrolase
MKTNEHPATPPGGWMEDRTHVFPVRVYYEDTDFSGFVYHASYLKFIERGRSEFLRVCGIGHRELLNAAEPLFWTVRKIEITYLRPARIEDAVTARTQVAGITGARMTLHQWIERSGERLTQASVEVCLIGSAGRPRRMPTAIRKQMEFYIQSSDNPAVDQDH